MYMPGNGSARAIRSTPNSPLGPRSAEQARSESGGRLPVDDTRDDELTRLGHTLNHLLARIDAGAARERQYLADAAHELRSPLTLMTTELEWATHRQRSSERSSTST